MALKLKAGNSRKPDGESGKPSLPTVPVAALEEHRRSEAVRERRERVLARMNRGQD